MKTLRTLLLPTVVVSLALAAGPSHAADYRSDILADIEGLETKIVGLAQAIPTDKYGWRPQDGVRSVSEALMHTAAANFFLPSLLGVDVPEGINPQQLESITGKDEAVETLKKSFAQLRQMVEASKARELDDTLNMFGSETTVAGALHAAVSHSHEHLGQMIAYARSVGTVPPWSEAGN